MSAKKKLTASEIDGVQYRRAKLWQIIFISCNAFIGMAIYSLIGLASYSASIGFGISTAAVGVILTCTRILDGFTDPLLALIYDKVNTKYGKIRILVISGFAIEALALLAMYKWAAGKGFGIVMFTFLYIIYIIGYTIANMTFQTVGPLISNDPKQRPTISVWSTALNYMVPMILSVVLNSVLLPRFGGSYNLEFLGAACYVCLGLGVVGLILVCIGVTPYDKPEYFEGTQKHEPLNLKDMVEVLRHNRPLQCYIAAATSDKIAQQTASQSIISTLMFGIIIGNMGLGTILSVIGMLPSILFAIVGAKYAGKFGNKETLVTWTRISMIMCVVLWIFFLIIEPSKIAAMGIITIIYVLITLVKNGANMCVTTANAAFMADIIDYELDRTGRFIPAVVTGTSSLIDKIVSSVSVLIATGAVALVGYTSTLPQPGDTCTTAIFWLTMVIYCGFPILGYLCTLVAMKFCKLNKAEMVNVQRRITDKKAALKANS